MMETKWLARNCRGLAQPMPFVRLAVLGFSFAVLFTGLGLCQTSRSSISGYVTDPSGLSMPGVHVAVTEESTLVKRETTTNQIGFYQVLDLTPGTYTVAVQAVGFQPIENRGVGVRTTEAVRVDLRLQIATTKAQVEVVAGAELIQTVSPELAGVLPNHAIEELPQAVRYTMNDTYVWAYLALDSGAMFASGMTYSFHGSSQPGETIDGGSAGPFGSYNGPSGPNIETVGEVKVLTSATSAEYRQSAVFDSSSKAGTNVFHGAGYWYNHTDGTDARNTFQSAVGYVTENNFGGTFAGPIVLPKYNGRNRSFFLVNVEQSPWSYPLILTSNTPTQSMRTGNLGIITTPIKDPISGIPFSGNQIPQTRISSVATNFINNYFPLPNYGAASLLAGNYRLTSATPSHMNFIGFRVDHHFSEKDNIFMHYERQHYETTGWNNVAFPTLPKAYQPQWNNSALWNYAHTFSPKLLNELHYLLNWYGTLRTDIGPATWANVAALGLQGLTQPSIPIPDGAIPKVLVTGYSNLQSNQSTNADWSIQEYYDALSYSRDRHTIKMGTNMQLYRTMVVPTLATNALGTYTFDGRFSGNAFADFLLGLPGTTNVANLRPNTWDTGKVWAAFITDTFRASRKLTLTFGVRDDYMFAMGEQDGLNYNFDPKNGNLVVTSQDALSHVVGFPTTIGLETAASVGVNSSNLMHSHNRMPAPRFGFAFSPTPSLVVRGAYGIYFDVLDSPWMGLITGGPFGTSLTYTNTITNGVPLWQWPTAVPSAGPTIPGTVSASGRNFDLRHAYTQQWNLTVERDVRHILGLRVSYIGSKSTHLDYVRNLDQPMASLIPFTQSRRPWPLYSGISYTDNGGNANYNALELDAEHRFHGGLYFKSGFTWAKDLSDDMSTTSTIQNTYNREAEYGDVPWDRHKKWVSLFQYQPPLGKSKRYLKSGVGNALLGNWELNGVILFETGQWFSPSYSGFDAANTSTTSGRPDCIANGNLPHSQQSINRWFNPSAFALPPAGRWGNCSPDVLTGPGVRNFNVGLVKQIPVREPVSVKLQIDTVNVFNHPNYQNPASANISVPGTVGVITGQLPISASNDFERDGPRIMRFGLRIEF